MRIGVGILIIFKISSLGKGYDIKRACRLRQGLELAHGIFDIIDSQLTPFIKKTIISRFSK